MSGIKKELIPTFSFQPSNPSPIELARCIDARPIHPHARALNRRSLYLRILQTICQPRYATHLLKQLLSEAPTGAYSPTITTPSALIMGRNR